MSQTKVSKHAALLRSLGFKPYAELMSKEDMDEVDQAVVAVGEGPLVKDLPEEQLRYLVAIGELPSFHEIADSEDGDCTFVMDEFGIDWSGPPGINLSAHGFKDNNQAARAMREEWERSKN